MFENDLLANQSALKGKSCRDDLPNATFSCIMGIEFLLSHARGSRQERFLLKWGAGYPR